MTHNQLQAMCATWFWNTYRFTDWANMYYQNKNNSEDEVAGAVDKALGTRRGVSDTTLISFVVCHFIEFKVGKDKQSQEQWEFQNEVELRGHKYVIISTFEEFKNYIYGALGDYQSGKY